MGAKENKEKGEDGVTSGPAVQNQAEEKSPVERRKMIRNKQGRLVENVEYLNNKANLDVKEDADDAHMTCKADEIIKMFKE